ncbi:MAG: hypothetical protein AAB768_02945 [Patescibacteria group bacterium]
MSAKIENQRSVFWYPGCNDRWWVPADWITYRFESFLALIQGFLSQSRS